MTIKMAPSSVSEALHLFEVMEKYQVPCSLEMQLDGQTDPFVGTANQPVKAEYIETYDGQGTGDTVVVTLGESEFSFELKFSVGKHITDSQISLCLAGANYAAWFNSGDVPIEGIKEARNYKEAPETILFDAHEVNLIEFIRGLEFSDLLDAHDALMESANEAVKKSQKLIETKDILTAQAWQNRSFILAQLATLLADSNEDYRFHIYPEALNNEQ